MKFSLTDALLEMQNQELNYHKIIFNYDILNDENNNFRNNTFSNVLAERKYKKVILLILFMKKI